MSQGFESGVWVSFGLGVDQVWVRYRFSDTQLHHFEGPEVIFDELPNGQKRYFKDLMSHKDSISNDPERLEYFHRIFECLQILWDGTGEILDKSEILEIYGKTYINSLELTTDSNYTIGKAVCLHYLFLFVYFSF